MSTTNASSSPFFRTSTFMALVKEALEARERNRTAAEASAYAKLREAFHELPDGKYGNAHVISYEIGGRKRRVAVYVQGRIVATYDEHNEWIRVLSPAEGEEIRNARRAGRRHEKIQYAQERERLVKDILDADVEEPMSFGGWEFRPGHKGGTFRRTDSDQRQSTITVAGKSAIEAAKQRYCSNRDIQEQMFPPRKPQMKRRGKERAMK